MSWSRPLGGNSPVNQDRWNTGAQSSLPKASHYYEDRETYLLSLRLEMIEKVFSCKILVMKPTKRSILVAMVSGEKDLYSVKNLISNAGNFLQIRIIFYKERMPELEDGFSVIYPKEQYASVGIYDIDRSHPGLDLFKKKPSTKPPSNPSLSSGITFAEYKERVQVKNVSAASSSYGFSASRSPTVSPFGGDVNGSHGHTSPAPALSGSLMGTNHPNAFHRTTPSPIACFPPTSPLFPNDFRANPSNLQNIPNYGQFFPSPMARRDLFPMPQQSAPSDIPPLMGLEPLLPSHYPFHF
ncbi:unnamed protein product [Caenorhabditis auriculariae]|uniref:Uncharacterized protein n=1 Tax=Caenorhabditis auriculariae TaxID=2777116 RepID=A0A8S1GZR0_9PELO|nr:unnamed protein product [Caenorhabditis auriculariae]